MIHIYFDFEDRGSIYQLKFVEDAGHQELVRDPYYRSSWSKFGTYFDPDTNYWCVDNVIHMGSFDPKLIKSKYLIILDPDVEIHKRIYFADDPFSFINDNFINTYQQCISACQQHNNDDDNANIDDDKCNLVHKISTTTKAIDLDDKLLEQLYCSNQSTSGMSYGMTIINATKPYPKWHECHSEYPSIIYIFELEHLAKHVKQNIEDE